MTLDEHRRHPEITIDAHMAARCRDLADRLEGKTAIYLDVRFWVMIREVRDVASCDPAERKIVHHLEGLVDQGRAFCPIAEPTFSELMKQGNLDQRVRTARAIDDLSGGVSLLPDHDRMARETETFLTTALTRRPLCPPEPIWTGLSYVLGNMYVADTAFGPADECAVQKLMFDRLWDRPLTELAAAIDGESYIRIDEREAGAAKLNADNAAHRGEIKSFDWVFEQERHGAAESAIALVPHLIDRFAPFCADIPIGAEKVFTNLIREALKNPDHARRLPTAHLHACIHALFRWEYRDKLITANDLFDFRHAAAAVGYCDAFLAERGICETMRHKRMALDQVHDCLVINDRDAAIAYLRRLRG